MCIHNNKVTILIRQTSFGYLIKKNKLRTTTLKDLNINFNDFYILKATGVFRFITVEEFLTLKYAAYIFYKKTDINKDNIIKWLDFLKQNKLMPMFLDKPFPPVSILNKIKI